MGRKQAFGLIASKTAAADIECLRSIREKKLFRAKGVDPVNGPVNGSLRFAVSRFSYKPIFVTDAKSTVCAHPSCRKPGH